MHDRYRLNCTGCSYNIEPVYHTSRDAMDNVSQFYLQEQLDVIGASYIWNALNKVDVTVRNGSAPVANATVSGNCGDGVRDFGKTDANGYLEVRVPHVTCDFTPPPPRARAASTASRSAATGSCRSRCPRSAAPSRRRSR